MQIKKALTSILVAGAFLFTGTAAMADYVGNTTGGTSTGCSCTGIVCPSVCPGVGNYTTGPDSTNRNVVDINDESCTVIENIASVNDEMMFDVDTSIGNIANNTCIGSVSGGDIDGNIVVVHDVNSGSIVMPSGYNQSVVAPVSMANAVTGPGSTNINRVNVDNSSSLLVSNQASYNGNYNFDLNTGGAKVGSNTSVGSVSTGSIDVGLIENVSLNRNASHIVLPTNTNPISIPDLANATTGPNSTNTNTYTVNNSNHVTVANTADINNNVNVSANTGGNRVENNTCVGNISTGDVRFNVSISSSAN